MIGLQRIRIVLWALVIVAGVFAFAVLVGWWQVDGPGRRVLSQQEPTRAVGGAFNLTDHRGSPISGQTFAGRPLLVFFGFTHCPDVCPTTLFEITNRLKELGPATKRIQVLFVSVDPKRDSPKLISQYLQSFSPRIVGATGTKKQIDAMVKSYRATYRMVPTEGESYSVDHTASLYMMDSRGQFIGTIDYHEDRKAALAKLQRLAKL